MILGGRRWQRHTWVQRYYLKSVGHSFMTAVELWSQNVLQLGVSADLAIPEERNNDSGIFGARYDIPVLLRQARVELLTKSAPLLERCLQARSIFMLCCFMSIHRVPLRPAFARIVVNSHVLNGRT